MRKCLVRFGHAVHFFALLHRAATPFGRFEQLRCEPLAHRFLSTLARCFTQPAHRERHAAYRTDLDRHLKVRTAHASALDLDRRLGVRERLSEDLEWILAALLRDRLEGAIDDALGDGLLAAAHEHVDELRDITARILRVGQDLALGDFSASGHLYTSMKSRLRTYAALGFFAPYLERPCLRSLTPAVSRLPRTM